jgi:hypothetical protein
MGCHAGFTGSFTSWYKHQTSTMCQYQFKYKPITYVKHERKQLVQIWQVICCSSVHSSFNWAMIHASKRTANGDITNSMTHYHTAKQQGVMQIYQDLKQAAHDTRINTSTYRYVEHNVRHIMGANTKHQMQHTCASCLTVW